MQPEDLNIRHLRAFRAVVQHKSISNAANEVFLSQPAVSQAIAKLEMQLKVTLFERQNKGMLPTKPGHIFEKRVIRALSYIQTGAKNAIRLGSQKKGFGHFHHLLTSGQLRALVAMEKAKSFSLAARINNVSQPTLHRAARDLERLSGIDFFEKTNSGIRLSRAAQILADYTALAFYELQQGIDELNSWLGNDTGRFVVGTMPLARTYILPTAIGEFANIRPEIDISIIDAPYLDLLHGLRKGSIDCLVGALREHLLITDVTQEILLHDSLIVVARPGHPLLLSGKIALTDLAKYPWVVPHKVTPTREYFETMFDGIDAPNHIIESSSLLVIRGLLESSDRLTLISAHQIIYEERQGHLKRLNFQTTGSARPIGMTYRKDWAPTLPQKMALDLIRQACRDAPLK